MPKLTVMCGIIGAGKTYYARDIAATNRNAVIVSSDAARFMLGGYDPKIEPYVWRTMEVIAKALLAKGHDVIIDSTALTRKHRAEIRSWHGQTECIYLPCSNEESIAERWDNLKEKVSDMVEKLEPPQEDEGFDALIRVSDREADKLRKRMDYDLPPEGLRGLGDVGFAIIAERNHSGR